MKIRCVVAPTAENVLNINLRLHITLGEIYEVATSTQFNQARFEDWCESRDPRVCTYCGDCRKLDSPDGKVPTYLVTAKHGRKYFIPREYFIETGMTTLEFLKRIKQ